MLRAPQRCQLQRGPCGRIFISGHVPIGNPAASSLLLRRPSKDQASRLSGRDQQRTRGCGSSAALHFPAHSHRRAGRARPVETYFLGICHGQRQRASHRSRQHAMARSPPALAGGLPVCPRCAGGRRSCPMRVTACRLCDHRLQAGHEAAMCMCALPACGLHLNACRRCQRTLCFPCYYEHQPVCIGTRGNRYGRLESDADSDDEELEQRDPPPTGRNKRWATMVSLARKLTTPKDRRPAKGPISLPSQPSRPPPATRLHIRPTTSVWWPA